MLPFMEVNSRYTGRRGVSLPFSDHCDPIIREETSTRRLLERTIDFGKTSNWKFLDMHGGDIIFQGKNPSREFYGHLLTLNAEPDKVLKQFNLKGNETLDSIHRVYMADPNGYLIMSYEKEFPAIHLIKDLMHLLKYSRVG